MKTSFFNVIQKSRKQLLFIEDKINVFPRLLKHETGKKQNMKKKSQI